MITRRMNSYLRDMKLWQHASPVCRNAFQRAMRGHQFGRDELREAFIWYSEGWRASDIARLNDTCSQVNSDSHVFQEQF
jgi:hypothetical protein